MPMLLLPLAAAAALATAADTTRYVVLNHGRPAGEMTVVQEGDSVVARYGHIDRNRGSWVETRYRVDAIGAVLGGALRPLDREGNGEVAERFEVTGDSVKWNGRGSTGGARREPGAYYRLRGGSAFDQALLAGFLLRQPERTARLLPGGTARLELVADTVVPTSTGPERVRYAMLHSGGSTPSGVWLDERDRLFASDANWFITVRQGGEPALPTLRAVEMAYRARQAAEMAKRLLPAPVPAVVIRNGDLFDSERGVVRPRMTVVVQGDRIVAVGPADSVRAPAGATVIDATGKTIVPGLWDMHTHLQVGSQTGGAIMQLAAGLTTVRDLAADIDAAVSLRDRAGRVEIVAPRQVLAGFIEGPGLWAGPSEAIARTEDEARAWVARYDSLGYEQIKLYNLVHPDLVPTIAAEARRRGMRLSGHVPRGLSVPAALALGFDEINHVAFLLSSQYPDSLYVPTMRAYSAVAAAVAPTMDMDGSGMTAVIDAMRTRGTVLDGTFNLWVTGDTMGTGEAQARQRAANANYLRLIKRLHDAGVTLVPGTDNSAGTTYHTELEIYERAGIPAAEVLRMATITSARVMKDDRDYGSIVPGKVADIVIVDGKPAERISDLRNVHRVVRAGRVFDPEALFEAVGRRRAQRAAAPAPRP
jgi:imidazolonepropionase-like amidohydrolase